MVPPSAGAARKRVLIAFAKSVRNSIIDLAQLRMVREGLWIIVAYCVTAAAGLISIRLFTELAPQSVFGSANLLIGVLTLGMQALIAPITQTQLRYHTGYRDAGAAGHFTMQVARFAATAAAIIVLIMSATLLVWPSARAGSGFAIIGCLAAWIAISTYRAVLINPVQAERQQKRYALWISSEAIAQMLCTAGLLAIWPTVEGYVCGQVAGTALSAVTFGRLPRRSSGTRPEADSSRAWRQIIDYGLPFAPFAFLGWLSNLSDRYVLATFLGTAAVGQYVAAFAIGSRLPTLLGGLLADLFRPALFEAATRSNHARANQLFAIWLAALGAGVAVAVLTLIVFGDAIANILLAEDYRRNASEIMTWIATGYGFSVIAQVVENRLLSLSASRTLLWTKLAGAGATLSFSILLIPHHGVIGAAVASAAGQLLLLVATSWMLFTIQKVNRSTGPRAATKDNVM